MHVNILSVGVCCRHTQVVTGLDLKSSAISRAGSNPAVDVFERGKKLFLRSTKTRIKIHTRPACTILYRCTSRPDTLPCTVKKPEGVGGGGSGKKKERKPVQGFLHLYLATRVTAPSLGLRFLLRTDGAMLPESGSSRDRHTAFSTDALLVLLGILSPTAALSSIPRLQRLVKTSTVSRGLCYALWRSPSERCIPRALARKISVV